MDRNHDGKPTQNEVPQNLTFDQWDADKDGAATREEVQPFYTQPGSAGTAAQPAVQPAPATPGALLRRAEIPGFADTVEGTNGTALADLNRNGLLDNAIACDPDNNGGGRAGVGPERPNERGYVNAGAHGARANHWFHRTFTGTGHTELIGARVEHAAGSFFDAVCNAAARLEGRWAPEQASHQLRTAARSCHRASASHIQFTPSPAGRASISGRNPPESRLQAEVLPGASAPGG